jgi:hypothetical protein
MTSQELIGSCRQRFEELALKEYDWVSFYNGWLEGRMNLFESMKKQELKTLISLNENRNKCKGG